MACRDWDDAEKLSNNNENLSLRQEIENLRLKLLSMPLPSLLCEACTILENVGEFKNASSELKKWFLQHEEKEANKLRVEAAEKLSVRERRLLGIDLEALKRKL